MQLERRATLNRHIETNQIILDGGKIKAFAMKTGALCSINKTGNIINMKNGKTRFCNDDLSKFLYEQGVRGEFLIHHKTQTFGVPKWLTFSQYNRPFNEWSQQIEIYTLDGLEKPDGMIPIKPLDSFLVDPNNIKETVDKLSEDTKFDGLILTATTFDNQTNWYQVLPNRYCQGRIVDYNASADDSYVIVEIHHDGEMYRTKICKFTKTMARDLDELGDDVLNRNLKVQYSTFIPGDRLENFSSPYALFVINRP